MDRSSASAARLHFIPRAIRPLQTALVRVFRRYFQRAPGWVLLTTRGRTTGLRREVLLPCERTRDARIVISTYGTRSDWIRNIRRDARVWITSASPFFAPALFALLNFLHRTLLRPIWLPFLRWWVTGRPIVLIRVRPEA